MKWILIIVGIIICLIAVIYLIGSLLPVKHSASAQDVIPATVDKVWDRITDVSKFKNWRNGVDKIEVINDVEWIEISGGDKTPMKSIERTANMRLVTVINSKDLPFGGEWVYSLQPKGDSTLLIITENGEVYNPIFRFVSRFIIGHNATKKKYMLDLRKSFQ
jgi:hypothetical protein